MSHSVLVLHGPNLNLLGVRERMVYGQHSLEAINQTLHEQAGTADIKLTIFQENSEANLIEILHNCLNNRPNFIIFNPAAFTHTSIALRDAMLAIDVPFIEVHLSNIYQRESFRHHSYFSDVAHGVISGFGKHSYTLALEFIIRILKNPGDMPMKKQYIPS